jgi:hypothetical protein
MLSCVASEVTSVGNDVTRTNLWILSSNDREYRVEGCFGDTLKIRFDRRLSVPHSPDGNK